MDSNQTTTVGLRNLAQAVRKHMTYARLVACHTKKNTKDDANGSNTTQYDDANDRDIMKDLENRLKVSEKTGAFVTDPLLPRSKAGLSNMHQTLLYQLLDNFICMICYEGSRFCGLDLHLHEWTTLVHTFVLCVLSRYVPGLDRRGAMVFASLQYLPLVWSFIDRNIVLTTQKNILKFLKLIMIGTIAYYNMERGHQKDEIQQITYDFQAVSNIVGYIGGLFLEQDKVRMIQAGIGAISIATRRYEKKIEYEDRTVNRDLTHDIVTRLLQLGPYVIQALHINQVHGQPFFQVLIDGVLVGMMFDRNESVPYLTGDTSTADDALKAMATQEKTVSKLLPQIDIAMNGAFLVAVSNWWMSAPSPATPELDKFAISNGLKELNDDMKAILQDNQAVVFHSTDDDDAKRRLFSKLCNLGMCMQDSTVTVYNQNATLPAIKIQHDAQGFHAAVYSQEWQALVSASTELSLHSLTLDAAVKNAWKHLFRLVDNGPTRASIDAESTDATWPMVGLMLRALASHQYIFNQLVGVLIEPLVAHYLTCGLIILTKTWRPVASFVNDPTNPNAVKSAFTSVADDLDNFLKTGSNALVATFLAPRLRQLFDWERATSPARTDLLYEATLAGWYTTAELKLRGNRRTQKKTPGLIDAPTNGVSQFMGDTRDDRLVKADLDVVDEYTRVTGFRLRYKVDASKRLKETNDLDAYEKTLVRRLELDESLLRDFKRAVVMARDGPCAYRSRLDDEGKTDPIGRASHLGTALTTFAPPDQIRQIGSISAHVQSSESSTTVEITDALNSAITNLLAVRGNAVEEYGHAKRLTQDSAFNHIHPLKNNRIVSLYYQRQLQLMCDHYEGGAWLNTIKFALLMRNLRPLCKDSPPNAETIQTLRAYVDAAYKMSLTRQAYDLLGRICIYNATEAPPKSVSYTPFEWVPALSSNVANTVIQSFLRNDNNSNDIIQAYLRASPHSEPNVDNGHAVWRTYLLLKDDYLLGTFAYPSSLLECTL